MKKLFTLVFLLSTMILSAQTNISTEFRIQCKWNESTEKFDKDCIENFDFTSRFTINDAGTMIVHTTPGMTSSYYVDDTAHEPDDHTYIYFVTSDVGNAYIFIFDFDDGEVRTVPILGGWIIYYNIKAIY